jgi:predicted HTH transcriptional regulator
VPEGVLVDYKRSTYGRSDNDIMESLKDVSSFANTSGGHLIIGVDEKDVGMRQDGGRLFMICSSNLDHRFQAASYRRFVDRTPQSP